jgi:RNA polymerase sigma factor (sigma-70 family)
VFDTDDLIATLARRLDELMQTRSVRATSAHQAWALVLSIARHAAREYRRKETAEQRHRLLVAERADAVEDPHPSTSAAADSQFGLSLNDALESGLDAEDHAILRLRAHGVPFAHIGAAMGLNEAAVRMRWRRLRGRLSRRMPGRSAPSSFGKDR